MVYLFFCVTFFFFKQKTAYEMRSSDWSSDVCSSDLLEDLKIRKFIMKTLPQAAISKVVIERPAKLCRVSIYAARPGVIIGKKGADIEKLRRKLSEFTTSDVSLNIVEIRKPEIDSKLVDRQSAG